jgi:hypothetical protein
MQRFDVHHGRRCHVHLAANRRVEHPQRNFDTAMLVPRFQPAMGDHPPVIHSRQINPDAAAKPRVPGVENFSGFGTMGVRLMACTTRGGATPGSVGSHRPSLNGDTPPGHTPMQNWRSLLNPLENQALNRPRNRGKSNAPLRKIIKTRGHFPSDEAATKLIWLALRNITADWGRAAKEWREAMNQFAIAYGDRFTRGVM